ncbi:acyl carrier protein [Polystyrenella longa]|uniref:Acyl carrier protein n=1 Tax=Polystyrenella longa TaxID=2528007 RepID=A0A518CNI6_9PLAN|nr:phosphopantetheine-binding protein [Polystyrenella longa]QDU80791.1 acyl carrier protein [Polystyrenella longa]
MSSTINPAGSAAGHPQGQGQAQPQIIHFDATIRRKDKMRNKAIGTQPNAPALNGHAVAAVQPAMPQAAPAPVQPTPAPVQAAPAPVTAAPMAATPVQPAAPAPQATAAASPAAVDNSNKKKLTIPELEQFLIDFVVEQTGYPAEMVELDADLEADLGIDSIKKAQMFGEIAEQVVLDVEIEMSADMSLDDFPTLRSIIEFITTPKAAPANGTAAPAVAAPVAYASPVAAPVAVAPATPTPVQPTPAAPVPVAARPVAPAAPVPVQPVAAAPVMPQPVQTVAPTAPAAPVTASHAPAMSNGAAATSTVPKKKLTPAELEQFLIDFVVEQTGYPTEMVEMDADLEADLGIDSIKKAQMFGEIAEQVELEKEIELTADMSLDDFPTLRSITEFIQQS